MTEFPPTPEQLDAENAYDAGGTVVIVAGAGAGKTSTLKRIARKAQAKGQRVLYLAYNKAIATEAALSFPSNTHCSTAHAVAYAAFGKPRRARMNVPYQSAKVVAKILAIHSVLRVGTDVPPLSPEQLARVVMATVRRFCSRAHTEIAPHHVPRPAGYEEDAAHAALAKVVVPLAQRAWADLTAPRGDLKFGHDHYFKMWQLSRPKLRYDVILLDECQDTDPVLAAVFKDQTHAQLGLVGDRMQAIYGWRGCIDIMGDFPDATTVQLTQSFRFGPAVAVEANRCLAAASSTFRIQGFDKIPSVVGPIDEPDAILCRTNAGAVAAVLNQAEKGRKAAMVGEGKEILALAKAARSLQLYGGTDHQDLALFVSWEQVCQYVRDGDQGSEDLKVGVKLIDEHGYEKIISIIEGLTAERYADVTISTAHKSKGREWDRVQVWTDFKEPKEGEEASVEELMLAYVTLTRAKIGLDVGSLSWIAERDGVVPAAPAVELEEDTPDAEVVQLHPAAAEPAPVDPIAEALTKVDRSMDPLSLATALLELEQARAATLPGYGQADRETGVRLIVAAMEGKGREIRHQVLTAV